MLFWAVLPHALIGRVQQLETNCPKTNDKNKDDKDEDEGILDDDFVYRDDGMIDDRVAHERNTHRCLQSNRTCMGGNVNNEHNRGIVCNNDPYAKIKFIVPPFFGKYDVKEHLDWEITEQKFASHIVPDHHKFRQAISEFKKALL